MSHEHPRNDLALAEAALFLAPQPLTRRALAKILGGVALAYVDQLLEDLKECFDDPSRGIELHIEDGRAMFRVKSVYVNEVAHLAPQQDIPRPVLRTLAVIAYNNQMTQADLIKVRGNKGYTHVRELLDRGLISSEDHGRTLLLSVTKEFLRHFGLSSVEEFRFHFAASPDAALADEAEDTSPAQTDSESEAGGTSAPEEGEAQPASSYEDAEAPATEGADEVEDKRFDAPEHENVSSDKRKIADGFQAESAEAEEVDDG